MARVSFEEFSAGLPVQRETPQAVPPQPEEQGLLISNLNPFSQKNRDRLKDIPSDIKETFGSMVDAVSRARQTSSDARNRFIGGETSKLEATGEIIGGGLKAGTEVVGAGLQGLGKLFTTPEEEEKIKNLVTSATEAVAGTKPVREIKEYYDTLDPQTKRNVQTFINVAEGLGTMFGAKPVFDVLRKTLSGAVEAVGTGVTTVGTPVVRTGIQATEDTLNAAKDAVRPAKDIVSGVGSQIGDFARRTGTEAIETAQNNRRLASLPKPEANIRRIVADERVIDLTSKLTPEELAVTQRLVNQAKLKQKDITTNTAHPKAIAGEELLKPVQHIIDTRKAVGAQLGELRKQLGTQKNVNTNKAFREFHTYLKENYGVQFDTSGKIIPGTGNLAKTDVPVVQGLYDELRSGTFMSQKQIDEFLQRSYKDYDLRQSREKTFSDDVSRIAEQARREMRQLMPTQYNALATEYATLSTPLVDVVKLMGYKGDLDLLTTKDLKAGEIALRILGNASDRPQSVIDAIVKTAEESGYKSNVNLNNIIALADQIEDLYDVTMPRSFTGQVTRGIDNANAIGAMGDVATMNVGGLYNRAMQSRASQKEIQNAYEEYLRFLANQN